MEQFHGQVFQGFSGGIYLGVWIPRLSWCSGLLSRFWDVLCSLWRQEGTDKRAKGFRVGSTRGMERLLWQVGGFRAVIGQFGGFLGFSGGIDLGVWITSLSWCCSSGLLSRLWDVLCSLWRQEGTDRRAKGFRVGSTRGMERLLWQVGGFRAVLGQIWGLFRFFRGVQISGCGFILLHIALRC